jgi:hypothetical protein
MKCHVRIFQEIIFEAGDKKFQKQCIFPRGGNSLWYIKKSKKSNGINENQKNQTESKIFLIPEILSNMKAFYMTI